MQKTEKARRLYQKTLNYTQNHLDNWDSNLYIYAVVLKKLGKESNAKKVLKRWLGNSPHSIVAQWSFAKLNHDNKTALGVLQKRQQQTGGASWNPVSRDYNFKLIVKVAKFIDH